MIEYVVVPNSAVLLLFFQLIFSNKDSEWAIVHCACAMAFSLVLIRLEHVAITALSFLIAFSCQELLDAEC